MIDLRFVVQKAVNRGPRGSASPTGVGRCLPGGQDHCFKAISDLADGDGFTGEKVMEISKKFDTNFPTQGSSHDLKR